MSGGKVPCDEENPGRGAFTKHATLSTLAAISPARRPFLAPEPGVTGAAFVVHTSRCCHHSTAFLSDMGQNHGRTMTVVGHMLDEGYKDLNAAGVQVGTS